MLAIDLRGLSALICASSRGLGFAVSEALLKAGARVMICGRDPKALEVAQKKLEPFEQAPKSVKAFAIDLVEKDASGRLFERACQELGKVDILVNNVGGPAPSSAVDTTESQWREGFERLFLSAVGLTQKAVAPMQERRFGRIITITSLSVLEPIEHLVVSTAMRQAVTGFMKTLASEVAPSGVTVNTVLPGVIKTQRIEELRRAKAERQGTRFEDEMQASAAAIPLRRLGQPEELAHLVAFLASPMASYITGTHIPVDGGMRRGL